MELKLGERFNESGTEWYPGAPAMEVMACIGCGKLSTYRVGTTGPQCVECFLGQCHSSWGWQPGHGQTVTGRVCAHCGVSIEHLRPQAKTCGAACRKAMQRQTIRS